MIEVVVLWWFSKSALEVEAGKFDALSFLLIFFDYKFYQNGRS